MKLLDRCRARWLLRGFASLGRRGRVRGTPVVLSYGRIEAGDDLVVLAEPRKVMLIAHGAASILRIGHGVRIDPGAAIQCTTRIEIGDRCHIGDGALLFDSDFHRRQGFGSVDGTPIRLGADCDVGARSVLLRGTTLAARVRVLPDSVVQSSFPADVVIGGNPARVIRGSENR